jgi:hypothetical protein
VILVFLSLTELILRLLGPVSSFAALMFTGILISLGFPKPVSPIAAAFVIQLSAYILPAVLAWLVLKLTRMKKQVPTPVAGRHWLIAGLMCTAISHLGRLVWLSGTSLGWLLATLQPIYFSAIPLFVVGLALAIRSLKPRSAAHGSGENAT